ncbi:hypothetical protein ACFQJC_14500 [Haloferax namakaokahaiae]|uniref:Uncharacterized protein n=1 Tax=Haloferax namakaokahaiae TaxID=1748331 RepID=A0ABD5ZHW8_9EURY
MQELSEAFSTLADGDFMREAGMVLVGFLFPTLVGGLLSNHLTMIPEEAYGLVVSLLAIYFGYHEVAVGGAVATGDAAAESFGVKQSLAAAL